VPQNYQRHYFFEKIIVDKKRQKIFGSENEKAAVLRKL
jgi:hypothetical protein